MTVNELYSITKQRIFEKGSSTIYDQFLIENVNRVLRENFEANNLERMFNGIAPLKQVPYVSSRDDELVYEDVFLNNILPLHLGAIFYIDDDLSKYNLYITDYKNELIKNQKLVSQEVIDAYRNTEI